MKKSALLFPVLVLSLAACGSTAAGTKTTSATPSATSISSPAAEVPTEVPTVEPPAAPEFSAVASDFTLAVKIMKKTCFGSAGCNVTYRIVPKYVGDQTLPDSGTVEVTYQVSGGEDGPQINTFTIEGGSASYDSEESLSTSSSTAKLKGKVTDVSYNAS